jgi:hypothetical protein
MPKEEPVTESNDEPLAPVEMEVDHPEVLKGALEVTPEDCIPFCPGTAIKVAWSLGASTRTAAIPDDRSERPILSSSAGIGPRGIGHN